MIFRENGQSLLEWILIIAALIYVAIMVIRAMNGCEHIADIWNHCHGGRRW